jgi:arabinosaccharide transport system substrate-binding protein
MKWKGLGNLLGETMQGYLFELFSRSGRIPRSYRPRRAGYISVGSWVVLFVAVASTIGIFFVRPPPRKDLEMWIFARTHQLMYEPLIAKWNREQPKSVELHLLSLDVLSRRLQSGFLSNVPLADLIEVERTGIGPVFAGPLEDVGFVDLTARLKAEGLMDQINAPSFSPWTTRGHIFGLPHDVHPVMLAYRADIVEKAGIDMSKIETWDDFTRAMLPLTKELDSSGSPIRYPLSIWYTNMDPMEALFLQAGGGFFDQQDKLVIDSDVNAMVVSQIVAWTVGPNRIAADAPEFTASGNQLRLDGYVVCSLMPDWLGGVWKTDMPGLSGKIKLMPLPAWTKGGRRTGVWGGTMLGIPKASKDFEEDWKFAKALYLSPALAETLWHRASIISPVKKNWSNPVYDQPDPYFCGQPSGRLYIQLAPQVPVRSGSPFNNLAKLRVTDAIVAVREYAIKNNIFDPVALHAEARRELAIAEQQVRVQIERNVFLKGDAQ